MELTVNRSWLIWGKKFIQILQALIDLNSMKAQFTDYIQIKPETHKGWNV